MANLQAFVLEATQVLLDTEATPGEQREAAHALFECLADFIGLDDYQPGVEDLQETWGDQGRAISPFEAARCLREYRRTVQFMQGTRAAIEAAIETYPDECIEVLYAGCGPFAPLALPLAHLWSPQQVRFTLLDIHPRSLAAACSLAEEMGVAESVRDYIHADAVEYRCPENNRPHVLVTETMQQALRDEPQVLICQNLVPQLRKGGFLVPERIQLFASLMGGEKISNSPYTGPLNVIELGCVMRLDRDTASEQGKCSSVLWPTGISEGLEPVLRTRIQVFGNIVLTDNKCSLNLPMRLDVPDFIDPGPVVHKPMDKGFPQGKALHFRYELAPVLGVRCFWPESLDLDALNMPSENRLKTDEHDRYLQLPIHFDPQPLQQELLQLEKQSWSRHPNRQDYEGMWQSLALRSLSGDASDGSTYSQIAQDYRDTSALAQSPYLSEVLASLPGRVGSARLLSLAPGSEIKTHTDKALQLWDGLVRLHVPIRTSEYIDFRLAGERMVMQAGECWYINANYPHSVINRSDITRVHLVVDCQVDDALTELFLDHGHSPRSDQYAFNDPNLTLDNLHQVIAELEAQGTSTSLELAQQMRKDVEQASNPESVVEDQ